MPAPRAAEPEVWHGFTKVWSRGFANIYTIRLARGQRPANQKWLPRFRWLAISFGPPLLVLIPVLFGQTFGWNPTGNDIIRLILLSFVNAGGFAAAVLAWGFALNRGGAIDNLLRPSSRRDYAVRIIDTALKHRWQMIMPMALATLPFVAAYYLDAAAPWGSPLYWAYLANIAFTLAIFGVDFYWLIVPPIIIFRLRTADDLALRWNDPARTPGIRIFSEGFAYPAIFVALAALAVTVPGLLDRPIFGPFTPTLYLALLLVSVWNGAITQLVLFSMMRRHRLHVLDTLAEESSLSTRQSNLDNLVANIRAGKGLDATLAAYGSVASAPGLPYGTALIVQYLAAVVGSLVGYVLQ